MNYLEETLNYLPDSYVIEHKFFINCIDNNKDKFYYNLTADVDGSIVGDITFTQKNGKVFIRENNIPEQYADLLEEALNEINVAFPNSDIFDISELPKLIEEHYEK